jgi:calcineurin-like phosphoesterase family protein
MANVFIVSDTHFGHKNSLLFKRTDGSPLRDFASVEEMDEHMVTNWNNTVGVHDKIYHLGDVSLSYKNLNIMDRLNGDKILIKGNHDIGKISIFGKYFRDVRASHALAGLVLTHIPIHPQSLDRWRGNVHGHLHAGKVMLWNDLDVEDLRYLCVCVEQINYTPISLEAVIKIFDDRKIPQKEKRERTME